MSGYFITKKGNGEELDLQPLDGLSRASSEYSVEKQPELKKGLGKLADLKYPQRDFLPQEARQQYKYDRDKQQNLPVPNTGWSKEKQDEWLAAAQARFDVAYSAYTAKQQKRANLLRRLVSKLKLPAGDRRFNYASSAPDSPARSLSPRLRILTPEDQRKFAALDRRIEQLQGQRTQLIEDAFFRGQKPTPEELGAYVDKVVRARERDRNHPKHNAYTARNSARYGLDSRWSVPFPQARADAAKAEAEAKAKADREAAKLAAEKAKKHAAALARRRANRELDRKLGVQPKRKAA